jgi:hypothetical protein
MVSAWPSTLAIEANCAGTCTLPSGVTLKLKLDRTAESSRKPHGTALLTITDD